MMNDLDLAYEYKLKSLPRGKDAVVPVKFKCNTPHRVVVVDLKSNCFLCSCDGHLPIPVGQVQLNFAVQKNNYKDLYNFVELCRKYNFTGNIHQLDDWGTWNYDKVKTPDTWTIANGTYLDHNVLIPSHPEHQECLRILTDIISQKNKFITYTSIIKNLNEQK